MLIPCAVLISSYLECLPSYIVIIKLHSPVHFSHKVQFSSAGLMASHNYLMPYTIIGCCRTAWSNSAWHICSVFINAGTENVLSSTLGDTIFKLSTVDLKEYNWTQGTQCLSSSWYMHFNYDLYQTWLRWWLYLKRFIFS